MSDLFSSKLRAYLSCKILNLAEWLPDMKKGHIGFLQDVRRLQRSFSKQIVNHQSPPVSMKIEYKFFRLIEIFPLEYFDNLIRGLVSLFPYLNDYNRMYPPEQDFSQKLRSIYSIWWKNVGTIVKKKSARWIIDREAELNGLADEIDFIDVQLHKFMPSLCVLYFDIFLSNQFTNELEKLQMDHYLREIRLAKLVPIGRRKRSFSMGSIDWEPKRNVTKYINRIRTNFEKIIRPYICGYLLNNKSNKPKLPIVEFFFIEGGDFNSNNFNKNYSQQIEFLGLECESYRAHGNNKLIIIPNFSQAKTMHSSHRILVFHEQYVKDLRTNGFKSEDRAVIFHLREFLLCVFPYLSLFELAKLWESEMHMLRQRISKSMMPTIIQKFQLKKYVFLNENIFRGAQFVERVNEEYEQHGDFIKAGLGNVKDMERVTQIEGIEDSKLATYLTGVIESRIRHLGKQTLFIKDWFSQYLQIRNISATHYVSIMLAILATISIVIGIIQIIQK